ncbi:MAG: serine acetyltransferase [Spongiibacteraceae bacterium]
MTEANAWDVSSIVAGLRAQREYWREQQHRHPERGGRELPSREALQEIVRAFCGALFPMRLGPSDLRQETEDFYIGHTLDTALNNLHTQVQLELTYTRKPQSVDEHSRIAKEAEVVVSDFANRLPEVRAVLDTDVLAAYRSDPAARSVDEVLICYPGIRATIYHRLAHELYKKNVLLIARIISELAHSETGIDIHPGAQIGEGFFIDHGTGVVIGETAVIGKRVRIYQAVTLGAKRFVTNEDGSLEKGQPRHPIVEDDVVIYAGATVLGRITIGKGSSVGGNVWLTHSVPPNSQITQATSKHEQSALV